MMTASSGFDFSHSPFENFKILFKEAEHKVSKDPNAMSLATTSREGRPSLRTVLFKGIVRDGFSFYTNYESLKAQDLSHNPQAALLFYWSSMDVQIRLEGGTEKLTRAESESYFKTRPRLNQIGAWASQQSQKIAAFSELEERVADLDKKYASQEIPCPPHWGGYHLLPLRFEFWFGKLGRLHQRYFYERQTLASPWQRSLKSP